MDAHALIEKAPLGPANVFVIVVTNGMDNSSHEYSAAQIQALIESHKEQGWKFIFLAANQDAITVGESLGVQSDEGILRQRTKQQADGIGAAASQVEFSADEAMAGKEA
jgi:hypothetical protein